MRTGVVYSFVFLLLAYPALAGDHVIVVDSSYAMRLRLSLKNDRNRFAKRPLKRQKLPFVQQQLEQYFNQIPNDGSRVYVVYYHAGIAKLGGRPLATEFVFGADGLGKLAALTPVRGFDAIVPLLKGMIDIDPLDLIKSTFSDKQRNNQLWSSFHLALKFAEEQEYCRPADPKNNTPEILPSIVLITDEPDDQKGEDAWNLRHAGQIVGPRPKPLNLLPGIVQEKAKPPHPDNVILIQHKWLENANAVWYQYGYTDPDSKDWKGKIDRVLANAKLGSLPLVNPPVIELGGKNPGAQVAQIKVNEPIQLKANGDPRFSQYQWSWKKVGEGKFSKPVSGPTLPRKFDQPGFYAIKLEGFPRGGSPLAAEMIVQVGNVAVAINPPDNPVPPDPPNPTPPKPNQELDITASFNLQTDGQDKQSRPIKMNEVFWIFGPKGIKASFVNGTVAAVNGNAGVDPPEGLVYDWKLGGAVPGKDDLFQPTSREFKAGQYTIGLTVSQKDNAKNTAEAKNLTFEVRQVQVKPSVKNFDGKTLKTKPGQPVEFQLNATMAPPGTTYKWDFGDGTPMLEGKNHKHVYMIPSKADNPFQPKMTATLPDGQKHTLKIATLVEVTKDMIVAKAFPELAWPGEEVTLKLPDIDPKEIEEVTWTVDGKKIQAKRELNFEVKLPFRKPGQTATFEVKKTNTTEPITGKLDVKIREVKPQIVSETKEVFIGQPIDVTVSNADGQPAFPEDHQVKFTGDGLNVTNPKKIFFTEPGEEKEIKAEVILSGVPFESATPVKIKVKGITPKIGIKTKK